MVFLPPYHEDPTGRPSELTEPLTKQVKPDGKIVYKFKHKTVTVLSTGVRKEMFLDGFQVIYFENGDIR